SVKKHVKKEMQIMKDRLSYSPNKLDMANVFNEAKSEREKVSLKEDMALELAEEAKAKVMTQARKLDIPHLPELLAFGVFAAEKREKEAQRSLRKYL
nr:hypothetical protein [Tanacetum cinerariifolium]